jgi:hypothetical protein
VLGKVTKGGGDQESQFEMRWLDKGEAFNWGLSSNSEGLIFKLYQLCLVDNVKTIYNTKVYVSLTVIITMWVPW